MNRTVPKIGAAITSVSVFLFAVFLITGFTFGSYIVCMFLPIGYIMTAAGFQNECGKDRRVPANIGLIFSAIYAALIFIVYFAQTTTVRLEDLTDQAKKILDYSRGGLLFNLDLLGYAMMALSTFFIGLSMRSKNSPDKWLKALMTFHGVFFISCFVLPMTGAFASMSSGGTHGGGVAALVVWCVYFLPIGILSFRHFSDSK